MKKFCFIILFFSCSSLFAQAPQGINYQGVARNSSGAAFSKTNIAVEFKLYNGNPGTGTLLYSELHPSIPTDTFGLYSLVIGSASGTGTGTFNSISWSAGNIWVEVWIDPANGTNFSLISQQQLMSVPYALYAQTSGSGGGGSVSGTPNNIPKINSTGNGLKRSLIYESADSSSIGINNSTPLADALVDMASPTAAFSGKGLLIPRMTDQQRTNIPVSALHHGLLVFQANSPNASSPQGFWYYDAVTSAWLILAPAQAVWTLSGNAAGTSGFLGTLDNNDIVFKTGLINPIERMRVYNSTKGGNVQFGSLASGNHYIFPAVKGSAGDILQMDPAGTNNLVWKPFSGGSSGPWTLTANALYPTNFLNDSVGIGPNAQTPKAMLDVSANTGSALFATSNDTLTPAVQIATYNAVNGYPALDVSSVNTNGNAINATANNAYALSGVSNDASALWVQNNSGGSATIDAYNAGTHSVAYFHNSAVTGTGPVLYATTSDLTGYSAKFTGGLGISTDLITIQGGSPQAGYFLMANSTGGDAQWAQVPGTLPPPSSGHILFDSLNQWKPSYPGNLFFDGKKVGIGTPTPNALLDIVSTNLPGGVNVVHSGSNGHAISAVIPAGTALGNAIHSSNASSSSSSSALFATNTGAGNAGFFSINNSTNSNPAIYATTNGAGGYAVESYVASGSNAVGIASFANSTGHAFLANSTGGGDGINSVVSGATGIAGNFQLTNNASIAPAVLVSTNSNAAALRVNGSGNAGGIAAMINAGSVGIGTGAANPTSGLDVKTSIGVSVKKYSTGGSIIITINDPNTVHIAVPTVATTFVVPDATLCPGRILIFTFDGTGGSGSFQLTACCSQLINGLASTTAISFANGMQKPSIGIVSDGTGWQIIFNNN